MPTMSNSAGVSSNVASDLASHASDPSAKRFKALPRIKTPSKWGAEPVSNYLMEYYHLVVGTASKAKSSVGVLNTAFRFLKSSFSLSLNPLHAIVSARANANINTLVSPSDDDGRYNKRGSGLCDSQNLSPVNFPDLDQYIDSENGSIQPHRLDNILVSKSVSNTAPRRMKMLQILTTIRFLFAIV